MRNQFCWLGNLLWTSCWEKGTDNFFPAMQKSTRKCLKQLFFLSYWIEQSIFAQLFVECPWIWYPIDPRNFGCDVSVRASVPSQRFYWWVMGWPSSLVKKRLSLSLFSTTIARQCRSFTTLFSGSSLLLPRESTRFRLVTWHPKSGC